jgi:HEAT repeat protein
MGKLLGEPFFDNRPQRYWIRSLHAGPAQHAVAMERLRSGGADAVPLLIGMLTHSSAPDEAELRLTAADLLAKLGPDAADASEALVAGTRDSDPHVQAVCAAALPKVGVPPDTAVPLLTDMLGGQHVVVAAQALSQYRAGAAPAVSALVRVLEDKSQSTEARWNAARTIGKIGPDAAGAVAALIDALGDDEWTIREHCAESLGQIGAEAAGDGVAALLTALDDPVARVRKDAARSLGQIGADEALPQIEKLLEDPEEIVRKAAQGAVEKLKPAEKAPPNDASEDDDDEEEMEGRKIP